jgi:NADH dehydrogenase
VRTPRGAIQRLLTADTWGRLLAGIDVVVNCVGILRQRGAETYERVHHLAPAAPADACGIAGVRRLVHVSTLSLDERVTSGSLISKRHGEAALQAHSFDCVIVRPSLLDGADGYGARWFRKVARWPVYFIPTSACGRVAPLDVDDLGVALAVLCEIDHLPSREIELGGASQMTIREYLARLWVEQRGANARPALTIAIPHWIARIGSHVCDLLHVTPFSFGHLQLMQRDNVPRVNHTPELL